MEMNLPAMSGGAVLWRRYPKLWAMGLIVGMALLLAGCGQQTLHSNQSEDDANEMVAVLFENGISASKSAADDDKWDVSVDSSDFSNSVEILQSRGLPRAQSETLCSAFQPGGISETPLSQRARLICATQNDLNRTIAEIDGVVSARVQLAMPEADPLTQEIKPSTASALVKYRTGFDIRQQNAAIKSLIANGVDGLTTDNVSVMMVAAKEIKPPPAESGISSDLILRILAVIAALLLLGFALRAFLRNRKAAKVKIVERE